MAARSLLSFGLNRRQHFQSLNQRCLSGVSYDTEVNALREDLAAAFRLVHMYGWSPDLIYNHISVRLPSKEDDTRSLFLINPYGLGYEEITASSLVTIDQEGNVVDKGSSTGKVNAAGFVVHSAVHNSRHDLHAVMHTHQSDTAAVSTLKCGLLPLTQDSMVFGNVTYHDYEGIAINQEECIRFANDLGLESKVMILRNHGILISGSTIAEMFTLAYFVHKACTIQIKSLSAAAATSTRFNRAGNNNGGDQGTQDDGIYWPKPEIVQLVHNQAIAFNNSQGKDLGALEWAYLKRKLDRIDESYKS
mmetsp:Transcript_46636/g.59907  ORF Transcript_46636/g.59907 Transcript_46636/m.59907 type:complete len:305 (-) Transcript_46636:241-1155(-)